MSKESCTCDRCVAMCEHHPCWPTPEEAQQLIDAGFGKKLMIDYWSRHEEGDIYLLCPSIMSYGTRRAPFWIDAPCVFLKDRRCELHSMGLKPLEAREAWCQEKDNKGLHKRMSMLWDTDVAREIVRKYEQDFCG